MRFGLNEGDLSNYEGRTKLYQVLFKFRPRNVWMSPRCRAWCRWNQFNACRSVEMAQKVLSAQQDDRPHLLLCEAVFAWQCERGPQYHFHLEQPVGSDMLYQECMQTIVSNTYLTRCDFCTAGNLKHPVDQQAMQKGTQILTTSLIMHQYLGSLRCSYDHPHSHVAGSFTDSHGKKCNVSQYSELYTQTFGHRIARTFIASRQVSETSCVHVQTAFAEEVNDESVEPAVKRRRLAMKVTNPPGYPEASKLGTSSNPMHAGTPHHGSESDSPSIEPSKNHVPTLQQVLQQAMNIAPRVGTSVLQSGDLFDSLQAMFPERQLRVVELCKGADRYRKPPVRLVNQEAPWRRTLSLHRQSLEPELSAWINWEILSNRKICAQAPPSRLMISMFGKEPDHKREAPEPSASIAKRFKSMNDPQELDRLAAEQEEQFRKDNSKSSESNSPTSEDQTPNQLEQLQESIVQHGPKFLKLPLKDRQWLSKIHYNMGHPNNAKLQAVLRAQQYSDEIVQGISDFRCGTCHELQEPRLSRPATLSESRDFNDCVGCDLVTWTSKNGRQFQFLHCIDSATSFQLAIPVIRTDAEALIDAIQDCWFHWAGPCKQLIIDNASPLCSEQFTNLAQERDMHLRVVAAFAHWQMGKTERHGDILQDMLQKYDIEHPVENEDQFKTALRHICCAKNALSRTQGYTPEILVLGKNSPLPGSIGDTVPTAAQYLADSDTPDGLRFRQQLEKRECARRAFISAENSEKLRRAFLRRQRPFRGNFVSGMFVMFWRPGRGEAVGQWHGPARVIIQESQSVVWISHASRVYRVAPEHVRCLSEREASISLDAMAQEPMAMPMKAHGKGVFQYEDLTEMHPTMSTPPEVPTVVEPAPSNPSNQPTIDLTHQPDSEPGNPPASHISSGYSATPPQSDIPDNEIPINNPEETPTDPKDVPVPDTSGDELHAEDYWILQGEQLIRVHKKPRTKAFEPTMVMDCPCDVLKIGENRITTGASPGQNLWSQTDQWGSDDASWTTESPWTGVTVFHVVHDGGEETVESHDVMHTSPDQAFECEVFLTEEDVNQIQLGPENFSILVATAAKRQHVEVKLKDMTASQRAEFDQAKHKEIDQWLATETVRKILRHKIPDTNILRCRWVLTWKDLDPLDAAKEDSQGNLHGLLGVHVDDGLCCGDATFDALIDQLEQKFPFGSKRELDFTFTGIHIKQDPQGNIHLDQKDYVLGIEPISIDRSRRRNEQEPVLEKERQGLRGLIGSLQYASINTRPDISAKLSFLQSKINCATIHDLLEANRLLGEAKKHADVTVTISSIPVSQIRLISYSDASFATREKKQSQKGGLILAVHEDVFEQKSAKASPLLWFSKKIDRVVASTLAAETFALSTAVDILDWMRLAWEWMKCPLIPWKEPERVWQSAPPSIAVVDCKSLFDVISKNTTPQVHEHRTLIEALVIKDHLQAGIRPHWVHSAAQLADALTKSMDCFRIRDFLKHGSCCLHDVDEILKERADKKAQKAWLSNTAI
eukprot:s764_g16.t1